MYQKTITAEEINAMPLRAFSGEIVLIEKRKEIDKAIDYLNTCSVLGFDTETKPAFKKGEEHDIALLQLASQSKSFLFRINKIGFPNELIALLNNPNILKIGLAIRDDIKDLKKLTDFEARGFVELKNEIEEFGIENFSLKKLAAIVLRIRISKKQQTSNWEASFLNRGQMRYAATDAWVALQIFKHLQATKENLKLSK